MSTTSDPTGTTDVRAPASDTFVEGTPELRETKPSMMTTEFWLTIAGVAALIIVYNVADDASLDLWRTCLLATIGVMAYVVSRGLAKSGSRDRRW